MNLQHDTPRPQIPQSPQDHPGLRRALRYAAYAMVVFLSVSAIWHLYWTRTSDEYLRAGRATRQAQAASRTSANGFDISNASIPVEEIRKGGPPRDGIPAILRPTFVSADRADFLRGNDKVIGFVNGDTARAYPLRILVWHEIANDTVGEIPIVVTYCPLCGTSMVFDRRYGDETLTFGVSGLLYQSDVLMYDHQTESLWSQLKMESVAGEKVGTQLKWLHSEYTTWKAWREEYPETEVLAPDPGSRRDYSRNPYSGYEHMSRTYFPVPKHRDELPNKEWVVGVVINGVPKAYPVIQLEKLGGRPLADTVGGKSVRVVYDPERQWPKVTEAESGEAIPHVSVFWFAWQAFYPATLLYDGGR